MSAVHSEIGSVHGEEIYAVNGFYFPNKSSQCVVEVQVKWSNTISNSLRPILH